MAIDTTIKKGHNQTDLLVLPEGWKIQSLEGIADPKAPICYGIVQVGPFASNGIPVLAIKNLNTDYFTNVHRSSPTIEALYARSRVCLGDVLISVKGTIGRIGIVPQHFVGNISRDLSRLRLTERDVPEFWFQMLQSESAQRRLGLATVGTTRMELSISILKRIRMLRPPKVEQQAIATALSDVDALLTSLDKLIDKKRGIKQATMQQLLTGRMRLPGFSGQGRAKLGDFFELNPGRTHLNNTDLVTFIGMEDISESGCIINQNVMPLSLIKKGLTFFERNDVLVAKITPCFENGKGACLDTLDTKSGFGSTEFHVLRAKKNAVPRYIFYQTQTVEFRQQLEAEMIGTAGQKRVPAQAIINYVLPVLHLEDEQTAIATVLSDMDAELAALEQKREKTRALKRAMMQELLSGRIRLL